MIVTKHSRPAWEDLLPVIHTGKLTNVPKLLWLYLVATGGVGGNTERTMYNGIAANVNTGWQPAKKALVKLKELGLVKWHPGALRAFAIVIESARHRGLEPREIRDPSEARKDGD